jgi:predicted metal-binding membrane protein
MLTTGAESAGCCAGLMLAPFALDPMSIISMLVVGALVFVQMVLPHASKREDSGYVVTPEYDDELSRN